MKTAGCVVSVETGARAKALYFEQKRQRRGQRVPGMASWSMRSRSAAKGASCSFGLIRGSKKGGKKWGYKVYAVMSRNPTELRRVPKNFCHTA